MRVLTPVELGLYAQDRRRRVLRLSQGDLAQRIGVSRYWVMDFEAGRPGVEIGLVLKALDVLGIDLHAFTEGAEPRQRTRERGTRAGGSPAEGSVDLADIVDAHVAALPSAVLPPKSNMPRAASGGSSRRSALERKRRTRRSEDRE